MPSHARPGMIPQPTFETVADRDTSLAAEPPTPNMNGSGVGDGRIYDDLVRDDQVRACFQQRRTAIVAAEWRVDAGADDAASQAAADNLREQLANVRFDDATDKMLYGLFYGYSVAECMYEMRDGLVRLDDILVRDRAHFCFGRENELLFRTREMPQGMPMPDKKFWVFSAGASHDDNPYGLGLAHSVYWPVFFKRNGLKFWMIFLEKFGMPTAVAKLAPGQIDQAAERSAALKALAAIQSDAGIVIPDTMVIELLEAAREGTADYAQLYDRMNAAISKVTLSQTMTTDAGSSLAQAEVHKGVASAVVKSDADMLCQSFNRGPAKWLTEWNFPGATPPSVWRVLEGKQDLNARVVRDTTLVASGLVPTEEYIAEAYGPGWRRRTT